MRKPQLDLLRAFAVFLVMGRHLPVLLENWPQPIPLLMSGWKQVGWIGVDLFFVLSGFLISGLLFNEYAETGSFDLFRFLVRRGFKIYPSYYVFLVLALPAIAWFPGAITPYSFACDALFISNYFVPIWPHTWSLCVEEHFYFLLSLSFFIVTRRKESFKFFIPGCFFMLVLPLVLRLILISHIPFHDKPHHSATALRLDGLTFGVILSYYYFHHKQALTDWVKRFSLLLVPLGFVLIAPCSIWGSAPWFLYSFGYTALYVGWGLILLVAMSYEMQLKNPILKLIAKIGTYSYSIYLWHKPFDVLCMLPSNWWPGHLDANARLLVYFFGSLTVGIFMSKTIEWPMLHIRDKLFPGVTANVSQKVS